MLYLIRWIALHLGRTIARLLLYPITAYFLLFAPTVRHASRNYLQRISEQPVHLWHTAKHIHYFSATTLDRVLLITGKFDEFNIQIHSLELIEKYIDSGKGCILLGSHIGSFEVIRALAIGKHQFPVKIIMQEAHNEMITRMLHSLNPAIADSIIKLDKPDAILEVSEYLQRGYLIGILGDRVVTSQKTAICTVLGAKATLPTGPLLAASLLNAPVLLFFCIYNGANRYDIYFEEFSEKITINRKSRNRDLEYWVQKYADRLTFHARQAPYNWFNFYDFWKNDT